MPVTITDVTTEFVTVPELKKHLNIPSHVVSQDDELTMIRDAAQEHVESLVGPILHRTVTQTVRPSTASEVVLNTMPALAITSIIGAGTTLTGYTLNATSGIVADVSYTGSSVVTYTVGRNSCPDTIRLATLIIAAHLWQTQLGNAPSVLSEDVVDQGFGLGFAVPARAAELLAPHLLLPGVA